MKARKAAAVHENGDGLSRSLAAKAATAQHLADIAKKHFKMLKAEYKQARKACKQAKKAAKRARKQARAAIKLLKTKQETASRTNDARKAKRAPVQRRNRTGSGTNIPLTTSASASVSTAAA